jgi:hypothetical protein
LIFSLSVRVVRMDGFALSAKGAWKSWEEFTARLTTVTGQQGVEWKVMYSQPKRRTFVCPNKNSMECGWFLNTTMSTKRVGGGARITAVRVTKCYLEHMPGCVLMKGRKRSYNWKDVQHSSPAKRAKAMVKAEQVRIIWIPFWLHHLFH